MKNLVIAFVLVIAGVAAVGFYRGWFAVSTTDVGHKPNVTFSVDPDKVREDEKKLKELGHTRGAPAEKTGEPDRRP